MNHSAPSSEGVTTPSDILFAAPIQSRETDERYTPAWIFEALGVTFDLDPASPPLGVSRVPTAAVWTKDDDGLTRPWHGFVWCNPPFSHSKAWADRFIEHGCGIWLGPVANGGWHDQMTRASDAMVLLRDFAFIGLNHAQKRSSMPLSMHGFGIRATDALRRFVQRQPDAGVLLKRGETSRAQEKGARSPDRLLPAVCTDPNCTIPRKPGRPMHGPHDFRAATPASREDQA